MSVRLAGCVIFDKSQKMHLLHRNKNGMVQWELPGGKVEEGESAENAAIRELKEELGIDVKILKELGGASFIENEKEFEYVWFLATIESGNPHICEPETFDDLGSFTVSELASLKLSGNMQGLYAEIKGGNVNLPAGISG